MREILFRGKSVRTNEWVYGDLKHISNIFGVDLEVIIHDYIEDEVDKNTIGQYTGLTDKNGKKIFEGDKVKIIRNDYENGWENSWGDLIPEEVETIITMDFKFAYTFNLMGEFEEDTMEVIGNIYDGDNK